MSQIWISPNGLWKIHKVNGRWAIENLDDGYIDWPIAYKGTTKVAYDDPYRIPKYVKKQYRIMEHRDRKPRSDLYWDGDSQMSKGFHRDARGVVMEDTYKGQWKKEETSRNKPK